MTQTINPLPGEPHHTQCPVMRRWCYREACDSALGCIELRRPTTPDRKVIERARDLVALWKNHKIAGLPRAERNAALDETRERLIAAVDALDAMEYQYNG